MNTLIFKIFVIAWVVLFTAVGFYFISPDFGAGIMTGSIAMFTVMFIIAMFEIRIKDIEEQ